MRRLNVLGSTVLSVLTLLCLSACEREEQAQQERPPADVEVYTTEELTVPVTYTYIGSTVASQEVDIRARVSGVVWEQGFEEGKYVEAGQFLFRIDPRPFEADLQIAEAQQFQATVAVQSAERDLNRTRRLESSESVSREELDNAISAFETAAASLKLAEANVLKARLELSYTTVTASVSGMVGKALKKPGDLVDNMQNSLLCVITTQDPMYVEFTVSEKDLLRFRTSVADGRFQVPDENDYIIELELLDGTMYSLPGRINYEDVLIDPQTGTGQYRAEFDNPDGLLMPGQFARVHVKGVERVGTIIVPQSAVMIGMQGPYVYVVEDGHVEMRPVEPSDWEGRNWIINDGLDAGEQVITVGTNKTAPGTDVNVTTVTTTLDLSTTSAVTNN